MTNPRRHGHAFLSVTAILGIAFSVTGCAEFQQTRNPSTSPLVLDRSTMPEIASVSVPMPESKPFAQPQRAEAAGLWGSQTRSFFVDERAQDVGDILTVIIEIDDEAELFNESERRRISTQKVDQPTFFGLEDKIMPGDLVDLGSSSGALGQGAIVRDEEISLRVAATIIEILPNKNFVIAGRQEVRVNSELRELRVAGIARPVDITLRNTISYDKIAEARIAYGGQGQISVVQRPRYGQDALEVFLPY